MKNIRSNCMTKPPCDLVWEPGGGGVRECGEQEDGRERETGEEEAGSFNSEVKHVLVGGAGDLKGADRRFE